MCTRLQLQRGSRSHSMTPLTNAWLWRLMELVAFFLSQGHAIVRGKGRRLRAQPLCLCPTIGHRNSDGRLWEKPPARSSIETCAIPCRAVTREIRKLTLARRGVLTDRPAPRKACAISWPFAGTAHAAAYSTTSSDRGSGTLEAGRFFRFRRMGCTVCKHSRRFDPLWGGRAVKDNRSFALTHYPNNERAAQTCPAFSKAMRCLHEGNVVHS